MDDSIESPQNSESNNTADSEQEASGQQPDGQEADAGVQISKDARMWAMFCHLAGLCAFILPALGNIIGPLIIWQLKKEDEPFVDRNGKEALNFQISVTIYELISLALFPVLCIGIVLLPAVAIASFVFLLIAAVKANNGEEFRYPLTIRFIK